MENVAVAVNLMLERLAVSREVAVDASPAEIVADSLGQMRFLVGLEELLGVMFDDVELFPFDLSSRVALMKSVEELLGQTGEPRD
ncbi:hypothetical protein ABZX66_18455 [Micromonospora aurantiaca]|uniref:hypothetical protein n=1 Tax=Micromonospora aurantiaca (nom. illeg.) TaxID=47850 RepID=UPI0033B9923A